MLDERQARHLTTGLILYGLALRIGWDVAHEVAVGLVPAQFAVGFIYAHPLLVFWAGGLLGRVFWRHATPLTAMGDFVLVMVSMSALAGLEVAARHYWTPHPLLAAVLGVFAGHLAWGIPPKRRPRPTALT